MALSEVWFHDKPNQPATLSFPKQTFGKKQPVNRAFQRSWFKTWSRLYYDEAADASFCYYCGKAAQKGKLKATNKDLAFITKGFTNCKHNNIIYDVFWNIHHLKFLVKIPPESISEYLIFKNFLGGMSPDPLVIACFTCWLCFAQH